MKRKEQQNFFNEKIFSFDIIYQRDNKTNITNGKTKLST